jgi:aspartate racemase
MTKHIGIIACSAEGAALCYRTICAESPQYMGEHFHPEITIHTHSLGDYMVHIREGNWTGVASLMLSSVRKVAKSGADFAICPDNTIHQAYDLFIKDSPIPWLHIADTVGQNAREKGYVRLGIIGTKYLMTGPVYPKILEAIGISCDIPKQEDRERIDTIIFSELVKGIFTEESRGFVNKVIQRLKGRGCEAVVLGCTEIPLLVDPKDCPLPTLDSTRLLAKAAIKEALKMDM